MRGYYGLGAVVRGRVEAPPSSDTPKIYTISQMYPISSLSSLIQKDTTTPAPFKIDVTGGVVQPTTQQQSVMYQCPNGKLISIPDISLCEEVATATTVTDSGLGKYLLPAGIILAAILLLK